jgi:aminopeptidase N
VPLVRIDAARCSAGKNLVHLSQGEFSKDGPDKQPLSWRVPVIAKSVTSGQEVRTLIVDGKAAITLPNCDPFIINAGQTGYYRTLYSASQIASIKDGFAMIPAIDQLGIISDAWSLGLAGLQPASDILNLASAVPVQAEPQVWSSLASILTEIDQYYIGDNARRERFRQFAIARLAPVLNQIGWNATANEQTSVAILRDRLIRTLGTLGDSHVIAEARRRYDAAKANAAEIPGALRKTILGVVAQNADSATWEELHAAALREKTALVKDELYALLSTAKDETLARRALALALTNEPGVSNSSEMIGVVAIQHPDLSFDFAVTNMQAINEKLDAVTSYQFFPALAARSADPAMIEKLQAFAKAHIPASARRTANTAVAGIEYRIKVRKERLPTFDMWLAQHNA